MATASRSEISDVDESEIGDVFLYPKQQAFVDSDAFISGFVGGRGTGKSYVASYKMIKRAKAGRFYMIVAPTYPVMMDTIWRSFLEVGGLLGRIERASLSKPPSITLRTFDGGLAHVSFRTGDNPENLRGPNASGVLLEEASIMHRDVLTISMACLREGGETGWLDFVFTPKGTLHWTYEEFFNNDDTRRLDRHLTRARTEDNPFNAPTFAANLRESYTSAFAQQEIDGEFVDLAGLMFQRQWFGEAVDADAIPFRAKRVRYWDKAATEGGGDYSAGVLMACVDGTFYVEDVVRGQWSPQNRDKIILQTAAMDKAHHERRRGSGACEIWIEQSGGDGGKESAILIRQKLAGYPVWTETVSGVQHRIKDKLRIPGTGKIVRAMPLAAQCEHGNVKVCNGNWMRAWLDEMCAFPEAKNDDQVDATAGAFNKLAMRQPAFREGVATVASDKIVPRTVRFDRERGGRRGIFGG